MTKGRIFAAALSAVLVAALSFATSAGATTFCVPNFHPGCPNNGTNVAQPNLETAANTSGNDGIADQVLVQPGHVYADATSFEVTAGNDDLLIDGGDVSTTITSLDNQNIIVANIAMGGNGRDVTLEDLTIKMPASFPDGLGAGMQMSDDTLQNVDFVSENPDTDPIASMIGGGTIRGGSYRGEAGGSIATAIRGGASVGTGTIDIEGIDVVATTGVGLFDGNPTVEIDRSHFHTTLAGVDASRGTINVRNSIFETDSGFSLSAFVNSASSVAIAAEGVTMVDYSPANTVPISAGTSSNAGSTGLASITLDSSIARDYQTGWTRNAAPAGGGSATISITHSNINPTGFDFGPGATTTRTNSIFADPLLADPPSGDFSLSAGSPSIDAGDPSSTLTQDFSGAVRPTDGDGDGTDVVDQGASEAPADTTAPDTIIDTGPAPGSTIAVAQATFTFHGDPAAETAKFQCKLDGAAFADCSSPKTYTGLTQGSHTVQVRAEDGAGNQDPTPASRTFTVDVPDPPDTTAPQTTIDSGPGKRAKKGKPKFRFSSSEPGSTFECSLVKTGKDAKFESCTSPKKYVLKRKKRTVKYTFSVRATDASQNTDATPAAKSFKVKKKP